MSRAKHPMAAQVRKKMKKEIRKAAPPSETQPLSDHITPAALMSRYPKKKQKQAAGILASLEKTLQKKKSQKALQRSKRTSPLELKGFASPQSSHLEGKRWVKNLQKQTNVKNKRVLKRQLKQK